MTSELKKVVIIGGGIIGCTTAYFLTRHPSYNPATTQITIIESSSIAAGASGKAGGLLALWAYPSSIVPLSYQLHAELAKEHGGKERWGYRTLHVGSLTAKGKMHESNGNGEAAPGGEDWRGLPKLGNGGGTPGAGLKGKPKSKKNVPDDLDWFDEDAMLGYSSMGTPETTAQVHPYQFTTSIADLAVEAGAKVIIGRVTDIKQAETGVTGVQYEDKVTKEKHDLEATDVIISAGPWTRTLFPAAPITATRAHSIVLKADVTPYAVFTDLELPRDFAGKGSSKKRRHGIHVNPEMYARPDGTIYACGETDDVIPLPTHADLVQVDTSRAQELVDYLATISAPFRKGEVLARQACYLPTVSTAGGPLIGKTETRGLFIAAGHTCWGIQNSCATGKLMSEFIFDGEAKSADISDLDPRTYL